MKIVYTAESLVYLVSNSKGSPNRTKVSTLILEYHLTKDTFYIIKAFEELIETNPPLGELCSNNSIINLN